MNGPSLRVEVTGEVFSLRAEITTVGRGPGVDVPLADPSVSRLHAEIVRRGPYLYVWDQGLSRNGTRVNGQQVGRRILHDGDVVRFGAAGVRVRDPGPLLELTVEAGRDLAERVLTAEIRMPDPPDLTRREWDVLRALSRPAGRPGAFVVPLSTREMAQDLVVTEGAVKQHLLRLYRKFDIAPGPNRRGRLANEAVRLGVVRPSPVEPAEPSWPAAPA
ncbi:FHA domain-containing protein [Frankia canadensis]|uniref:FHA domain-containing protein n=1 Tax=Frankia canadensis TaxID=1836972 RepID=A0A2I2KQI2_9ACTN|nr:FHA domain-containing protein [Frankia canadensis]SNQ47925.1 FHA domain-containing protein [Frankia canadensis]SOU55215.1 FHA domain-containing protein [Frankia canadensis]